MMIRFATLNDDGLMLAQLVYHTDNIIPFIFGKESTALLKIKSLIERDDNLFSYKNILVYKNENSTVKGIILFYSPQHNNEKKEADAYRQVFSTYELIPVWFKSLFLKSLTDKSEIDGLYIQNISVDASARGEGIGTQLMNYTEEWAAKQGVNSLWLDVSFNNPKAKKLYERQGFSVVSEHKILFSSDGFFRMKKRLSLTTF